METEFAGISVEDSEKKTDSSLSGFENTFRKSTKPQRIVFGIEKGLIVIKVRKYIFGLFFRNFRNPFKVAAIFLKIDSLRRKIMGEHQIKKIAEVNGKYYWDLYTPGCPSKPFEKFILGEANRIYRTGKQENRFTNVIMAITKKCSLHCEHCFEWDALNGKEILTLFHLKSIVSKLQEKGVGQIQFSGGEPLLRINDLVEVLKSAGKETEFWILTSGYQLNYHNAQRLKEAGLSGVVISLDHFEPEKHNSFRGFNYSFEWVEEGIKNAIAVDLVTAVSICTTRSFLSESNLMAYMNLSKKLGVSFVQILEPKAVGHYKDQDVSLTKDQELLLENFYQKMNYDKNFVSYPIVIYHGYHQRRTGCFSSGNRNFYIDTDGDAHACTFCHTKKGSILSEDFDQVMENLQSSGCHSFTNFSD